MLRLLRRSPVFAITPKSGIRPIAAMRFQSSFMKNAPGPPKLPKEEQEEFEKLIQVANTQVTIEDYNAELGYEVDAPPKVDVGEFSPELFKIIPEFEGNVNPATGEVNGPKQDPLKHGSDWSFNGRVTDF
ncbi:hypothetical protein CANARDRAFT_30042 [[Candida] arabinofermentans NRRL YB-2248]|uniref:Succinate dehydrogenase assembly factor 4, mitochondrial n=1 Tax=[Candida] arabinofermentans NRRL YB-2248 TaxID=983967 RepID=A0A1E4SV92_9ASCO|nr:hypothetical protein CANARDRAFT_30042 [[Candida] arabinofermentans NRRL YB-2248]